VAQLLHRLASDDGFLLISVEGETNPDRVLGEIATRFCRYRWIKALVKNIPGDSSPESCASPSLLGGTGSKLLVQMLLETQPVAFLFDNFENNLTDGAPPQPRPSCSRFCCEGPGKAGSISPPATRCVPRFKLDSRFAALNAVIQTSDIDILIFSMMNGPTFC
jgi:hypothetical protein